MNIKTIKLPDDITALVIGNYYTQEELSDMCKEMEFLFPKLGDENETGAATESGQFGVRRKKRGYGVFLDTVYTHRRYSNILEHSRKLFHNQAIKNEIDRLSREDNNKLYWKYWSRVNFDSTLLQYYRNGDYYEYHNDQSIFTAITTLKFKDSYQGGNLMFRSADNKEMMYAAEHNSTILFPSIMDHKVAEIFYPPSDKPKSIFDYRWSIAHLISYRAT